jgi:RNA recognition motif-containing protein
MSHGRNECRIYVGNLPPDIRTKDIQDLFHKFGKVTFVDLKNRRGPPFAFVEFEDARYVKKPYRTISDSPLFSKVYGKRYLSDSAIE